MSNRTKTLKTQKWDPYCWNLKNWWAVSLHGFILLSSKNFFNECMQAMLQTCIKTAVLYSASHTRLAERSNVKKIYIFLRENYKWLYWSRYAREYGLKCKLCRKYRPSNKLRQILRLFPPPRLQKHFFIKIFEPLLQTKRGNDFLVMRTAPSTMLSKAITVTNTTTPHVAIVVLEKWAVLYDLTKDILTYFGNSIRQILLLQYAHLRY